MKSNMLDRQIYQNIYQSMQETQIVILTGLFGSGKTTTLKHLYKLIPQQQNPSQFRKPHPPKAV